MRRTALGGLPAAAAAATRKHAAVRPKIARTSHAKLVALLKEKAWQIEDLEQHPVCLGVPLGQDGGSSKAMSVDMGLKTMAKVSMTELIDASPKLKEKLVNRALASKEEGRIPYDDLLRTPEPIPMSVAVMEDMMKQPVASALHPKALDRSIPTEVLEQLDDPFLRTNFASPELNDLIVEAVPGADPLAGARAEYRREVRSALIRERNATNTRS